MICIMIGNTLMFKSLKITFQIFQVIENPAELEKLEVFQVNATLFMISVTTPTKILNILNPHKTNRQSHHTPGPTDI